MRYVISISIFIWVITMSWVCFADSDYQIKSSDISNVRAVTGPASSYSMAELSSLPMVKTMGLSIVVKPDLTKEQYKGIIGKAISEIRNKDNEIDRIHMLVYDSDYEALDVYSVAMVLWCPGGNPGTECSVTADIALSNDRNGYETKIEWAEKYE